MTVKLLDTQKQKYAVLAEKYNEQAAVAYYQAAWLDYEAKWLLRGCTTRCSSFPWEVCCEDLCRYSAHLYDQ